MAGQAKISVIINTLNEELNIERCLKTVLWADEIVIVDMHSADKTVEIARRYTDKIYDYPRHNYVEPARMFALSKAANDWVLIVDADELVPAALKRRLKAIANEGAVDVVSLAHNNYFFGRLMVGTRWGPLQDMHYRFFRKTAMSFTPQIHNSVIIAPGSRILTILNPAEGFIHFNYYDYANFLDKFNIYSTIEAKQIYEGLTRPKGLAGIAAAALKEFVSRFVKHKGYRDGFDGLILALLMSVNIFVVQAKYRHMQTFAGAEIKPGVRKIYDRIAQAVIAEHSKGS